MDLSLSTKFELGNWDCFMVLSGINALFYYICFYMKFV